MHSSGQCAILESRQGPEVEGCTGKPEPGAMPLLYSLRKTGAVRMYGVSIPAGVLLLEK